MARGRGPGSGNPLWRLVRRRARATQRRGEAIRLTLREGAARVRANSLLVVQCAVATSMSWGLATTFFMDAPAVFAPITALVTLAVSMTERLRRSFELVLGVALGLFVSDLLVQVTGTGAWQLALIVTLSMVTAMMLGGSTAVSVQAGATGIIIATVVPVRNLLFDRLYDALIGGAVGLIVGALLLPAHPVNVARRAVRPMLEELAAALVDLAEALRTGAHSAVRAAAEQVREVQRPLDAFVHAVDIAEETVRLAPYRWRTKSHVAPYLELAQRMDPVMRNLRVLTRRSRTLLAQREPVPAEIPDALDELAQAVRLLLEDLLAQRDPERVRAELLRACRTTADVPAGMAVSAQVIVAQLRSTAVDFLRVCGLSYADADEAVRSAVTKPRLRPGTTLLRRRPSARTQPCSSR